MSIFCAETVKKFVQHIFYVENCVAASGNISYFLRNGGLLLKENVCLLVKENVQLILF